jgi:hypothetical protein
MTHSTKGLMVLTLLSNSCFGFVSWLTLLPFCLRKLARRRPSGVASADARYGLLFWRGARARAPGYRSWSVQAPGLNFAATRALGVPQGINRQQWSARSVVLAFHAGPWDLGGLCSQLKNLV